MLHHIQWVLILYSPPRPLYSTMSSVLVCKRKNGNQAVCSRLIQVNPFCSCRTFLPRLLPKVASTAANEDWPGRGLETRLALLNFSLSEKEDLSSTFHMYISWANKIFPELDSHASKNKIHAVHPPLHQHYTLGKFSHFLVPWACSTLECPTIAALGWGFPTPKKYQYASALNQTEVTHLIALI